MVSFFRNIESKNRALKLYDDKLGSLGIHYEIITIETSFGNTNILMTGNQKKPPMILVHGSNGCAPVAIEALQALIPDFRIYAVDVVGQPNRSEECRPNMNNNEYGQWMFEILSRLNVRDAIFVGISFGGFIGWKTLVFDEKRIAKAFLITPPGIIENNLLKVIWNLFLPMKLYNWRKKEKHLNQCLENLFSENDQFARQFLSEIFLNYEMDFSSIPLIKKEEAQKITTPVYIVGTENDLLFPGEKLQKKSRVIFPSLKEFLFLPNSKHVPSESDNDKISHLIKKTITSGNVQAFI